MGSTGDALARVLKAIPSLSWPVGAFVEALPDGSVRIDFGQGPVACLSAGFYEPLPGESVRVLQTTEASVMIGPARPRSVIGSVTATGSPYLTVDTSVGEQHLPYLTSYSASTSDLVVIFGNVVLGKVTVAPAGTYTPETPPGQEFKRQFRATDSGSYQSGTWNKDQVWCSSSNIGAWFYPDIDKSIPDGATILSVRVRAGVLQPVPDVAGHDRFAQPVLEIGCPVGDWRGDDQSRCRVEEIAHIVRGRVEGRHPQGSRYRSWRVSQVPVPQ